MSEVSRVVMDVLLVLLRYGTQASASEEESKAGGDATSAGQPSSGSSVRSRSKLGCRTPLPLQVLQVSPAGAALAIGEQATQADDATASQYVQVNMCGGACLAVPPPV